MNAKVQQYESKILFFLSYNDQMCNVQVALGLFFSLSLTTLPNVFTLYSFPHSLSLSLCFVYPRLHFILLPVTITILLVVAVVPC